LFSGLNSLCEATAKVVKILLSNHHWSPLKFEHLSHPEIKAFVPALERSMFALLSQVVVKKSKDVEITGCEICTAGIAIRNPSVFQEIDFSLWYQSFSSFWTS
jgi:hypothetical protein